MYIAARSSRLRVGRAIQKREKALSRMLRAFQRRNVYRIQIDARG